jgi:hypothetical protein
MTPVRARTLSLFFLLILAFTLPDLVSSNPDKLTTSTTKSSYGLGETVTIYGTLKNESDAPVSDGLVAVQVDDVLGNHRLVRVIPTGSLPPAWKVRIVEFLSCDSQGNPKTSFSRDTFAWFKVTVENLDTISRQVTVIITLVDSGNGSINVKPAILNYNLQPGEQLPLGPLSILIPHDAVSGTANGYVSALTKWPRECGQPYCPEVSLEFAITGSGSGATVASASASSTSSPGSYGLYFRLPTNAMLGNYYVYASGRFNAWASTTFDYFWRYTDVNRDGAVNIQDISMIGRAYGSKLVDPRYDHMLDLNNNGIIDIVDISRVARDYGKKMG